MNNGGIRYIIRFILLVFVQVFILNKIQLSGYINPYLYVLFILTLPISVPKWLLLLSSFFLGLSVDYFSGVPGIHAAASVFMAYARPGVIKLVGLRDDMDPGVEPGIKYFGALWFITYSFILVFLHHIFLFYIEVFRFNEFFITLFRAFVSTLVTVLLVMVVQYLFYRSRD